MEVFVQVKAALVPGFRYQREFGTTRICSPLPIRANFFTPYHGHVREILLWNQLSFNLS